MKSYLLILFGLVPILGEVSQLSQNFINRNIRFSADVYQELLKTNSKSFLVCPLSVQVILALAHSGAEGTTAQQIASSIHLPANKEEIFNTFTRLAPNLQVNGKYILSSANKICISDRFKLSYTFKNIATGVFNADVENIDFLEKQRAASSINRWVEEKTYNKIKNLINPNSLTADAVALLVNAMYLKANWMHPFDSFLTKKRPFFISSTNKIDTDMMETVDSFNYYDSKEWDAQFLELPYEGKDVTMTFVLPNSQDGLHALEVNIAALLVAPKNYHDVEVSVSIPKFKMETSIKFKPILEALGMHQAFTKAADFRGIGINERAIYISDVVQKTFIEVNEKGTTAAASTATLFVDKSFPGHRFNADHPFLFYISHRITGILFIGRFSAPDIPLIERSELFEIPVAPVRQIGDYLFEREQIWVQ